MSNALRRRKPSNSISSSSSSSAIAFDKGLQVNYCNNACIVESTISSNRDESLSTGTDLSLNSSQYRSEDFIVNSSREEQILADMKIYDKRVVEID
ncbi:hypothetical protein IEQ34_005944 [Dendrobium chrysotoxum]|uniref:Uncharacterized protein n=1 Tax=Dendrobium chrysotoxum TaxID=161865 RepID=A0AAV7H9Y9_DENCH|nr:hypothetical protein IEQ34_005944 [Dendrobium chrysotoxum]